MSKILNNLPVEDLNEENDYLGIIDKGQIIKTFLENNTDEFKDIKMFSLYGEWGSGKSTLMKYLQKELKGSFNTFFFEAWEFESDENLSCSLLEYLIVKSKNSTDEAFDDIIDISEKLFRGFSKAITIKTPLVNINGKEIVQSFEEEKEKSFLELKDEFKTEFIRWEDYITKGKNPKYNVVFIDDLDRCEPENVLNLLSALKLFFTYGQRTIFLCGVDKKAVNEAVKTKYGKVVKANQYLEKVFDISFNMPKDKDIYKLINIYFGNKRINDFITDPWNTYITKFFVALNFDNPRRIKKVLNKFAILQKIQSASKLTERYKRHIPNIYTKGDGNILETVFVLYLIILLEFYSEKYEKLFDLKHKEYIAVKAIKKSSSMSSNNYHNYLSTISHYVNMQIINLEIRSIDFHKNGEYDDIIFTMLPDTLIEMELNSFGKGGFETMKFSEVTIEHKFLQFLLQNQKIFMKSEDCSQITLLELKRMISSAL